MLRPRVSQIYNRFIYTGLLYFRRVLAGRWFGRAHFGYCLTLPVPANLIDLFQISRPYFPTDTYGFYTLCVLISVLFVAKYAYETKGVELKDMKG